MIETHGASSVYMPDQGWFLFGGNNLTSSQKLTNIDSNWEKGPAVFTPSIYHQCAVQVIKRHKILLRFSKLLIPDVS